MDLKLTCTKCNKQFTPSEVLMKFRKKRGKTKPPKLCMSCTWKALEKLFEECDDKEEELNTTNQL